MAPFRKSPYDFLVMPENMTIRPFGAADVKTVASLYEKVVRSGRSVASAGLESAFHSLFVASPLVSQEIPPLVLESAAGLQGFQGRHVRTTNTNHQLVSLGPLFVSPQARSTGAGLKLLSQAFQGPQHLTYSDGASEEARRLWERLGGRCSDSHSMEWIVPLRPATTLLRSAARGRNPRISKTLAAFEPLARQADRLLRERWYRKLVGDNRPSIELSEISEPEWIGFLKNDSGDQALSPLFTDEVAEWTLNQLRSLKSRGTFLLLGARRNRSLLGTIAGYSRSDRTLSIMQLRCDERYLPPVLSALIRYAHGRGMTAVEGRLDATVKGGLGALPLMFRRSTPFLVHGSNHSIIDRFLGLDSAFSRIDGEWIMNLRAEAYA